MVTEPITLRPVQVTTRTQLFEDEAVQPRSGRPGEAAVRGRPRRAEDQRQPARVAARGGQVNDHSRHLVVRTGRPSPCGHDGAVRPLAETVPQLLTTMNSTTITRCNVLNAPKETTS